MRNIKILHCGDLHFDTVFAELDGNMADTRREDLRETFGKIINECKSNEIDLLLISGDIFDNNLVMYETATFILKKFNEIPKTKVFISPGNHDAFTDKSFYSTLLWPDNVHIFKPTMEKVEIPNLNTVVYGAAFSNPYEKQGLLNEFNINNPEKINIMVMHGDYVGNNGNSNYNPICDEDISNSGLDYLALGHIHTFSGIKKVGKTSFAYPGCPEGRGFDEIDSKGIIIGEINKDLINLDFKEICKRKYKILNVDITDSSNYDDIVLKIYEKLELHNDLSNYSIDFAEKELTNNLYKIFLRGNIEKEFKININVLYQKLKDKFFYLKLIDETEEIIDYDEISKQLSLRGVFVKEMLEKIKFASNEEEKEKLRLALKIGLNALDLKEVIY
ncbi:DNA repair exonuclease [Clostridium sp. 19966]|uniref:metallophosphoesterase family protein n=1 Tax=Clostridium sp. 19966 TaxID=2768166 RepID=UPI0028DFEFE0|nr:DNA repair exonuclease [Clostridium sp. 19966]MDT8716285.1 DNA repair exonuclease [Clostridium sp. 19966]